MAERGRRRLAFAIRRWPVRWRLAGVSAGLTLLILVVFALVVGRLATDRVKDDFHEELVSVASQLRNNIQLQRAPTEGISGPDVVGLAMTGDAAVRIVDGQGNVATTREGLPAQTPGAPDLGPPEVGH